MFCSRPRCRSQDAPFTYFDTEAEGKFSLGLVYRPGGMRALDKAAGTRPRIVEHFGFVVRDIPPVSAFWQRLGLPRIPMDLIPERADMTYMGKPLPLPHYEEVDSNIASSPITGLPHREQPANLYADYLKGRRREGMQHIALIVPDFDKAVAARKEAGLSRYAVQRLGHGRPARLRRACLYEHGKGRRVERGTLSRLLKRLSRVKATPLVSGANQDASAPDRKIEHITMAA